MRLTRAIPLLAALNILLSGCQEEPKPFSGNYNDASHQYYLSFKNGELTITTPDGPMTKNFSVEDNKIEVLYWDAVGKDTKLYFIENELKTQLHCKECAKYQLPTSWNLDAINSGKN